MDFKVDIRSQQTVVQDMQAGRKGRDLAKLRQACNEFEAIYINEMLKTARQTIPEDGLFEKNSATNIYEEMQDMEQARSMSQHSSIGIADAMYKKMSHLIEDKKE